MRRVGLLETRRYALIASAIAFVVLALGAVLPRTAAAARGLELGLTDPVFTTSDGNTRAAWLTRAQSAHADLLLLAVGWDGVAPRRPLDATDPADPAYNFSSLDQAVVNATARGFQVAIVFTRAPTWAEGPNRPSQSVAPAGSWRPDPTDVGQFARAIAERYSGHFMGLPAVHYWQLWAEPNLGINLSPQFENGRAVGFDIYRPMLNAFYNSLKAVSRQNVVITGGTAPYGNLTPAGGLFAQRMQPLTFWRGLLCYQAGANRKRHKKKKGRQATAAKSGGKLIPLPCPDPARFDIAAHHPINVGAPTRAAINPDDISTPDLYKLKRVLRAAAASGRAVPGGAKPLWATEIWWNSNPPSRGLPLAVQARYLEQGFYVLWKQGVQAAVWFEIRDLVPDGVNPIPTSGLFFHDGSPKPAAQAFAFPFVTERLGGNRLRAWGEAPGPGPVSIEICRHRCHHLKTLSAGANRVFLGTLHIGGKARLRATQGSQSSLIWRQN